MSFSFNVCHHKSLTSSQSTGLPSPYLVLLRTSWVKSQIRPCISPALVCIRYSEASSGRLKETVTLGIGYAPLASQTYRPWPKLLGGSLCCLTWALFLPKRRV